MTINKLGIITPTTARLQGCVARNAPETTRGSALLSAAAAAVVAAAEPQLLKRSREEAFVKVSLHVSVGQIQQQQRCCWKTKQKQSQGWSSSCCLDTSV